MRCGRTGCGGSSARPGMSRSWRHCGMPPRESHRAAVGVGAAPACGFAAAVGIGALAQAMVAGQPPRGRRPIGSGSAGCRGSGADRDGRGLFHRRHPGCRCCRTPGTPCGGAGLSSRPAGRPACGTLSGLGRRMGLQWDVRDAGVARRGTMRWPQAPVMSAERQAP